MRLRLLPWSTTWACVTRSSGTNGAGTDTTRPDPEAPIITPVARLVEPAQTKVQSM